MKITLIDSNARGLNTMLQALGICRGKECTLDTLDKALEAKPVPHMSVLEFGWVCLLVEGVSVKTRIQVLRSRLFSTMERSTRSIDMGESYFVIPETSIRPKSMQRVMTLELQEYALAKQGGESLEDSAYLLPLGIETSFFMAGNLRIFFEYFQKRLCKKHVQDEHYRLALDMWHMVTELFPIVLKAHPCKACRECMNSDVTQ